MIRVSSDPNFLKNFNLNQSHLIEMVPTFDPLFSGKKCLPSANNIV